LKYVLILTLVSLSACGAQLTSPFRGEHQIKAEETFNDADMIASLEQILLWHQTNQTELAPALNPGKARSAILEEFADLPCQPTEELIQLWAWHNGTRAVATPFIWYHDFLSVEQAISEYKWLTKYPLVGWQENWIPIFDFEGEWYFVECSEEIRQASPVGFYFLEDTETVYAYTNLTRMLETSVVWFNQNAVTWDNEQQGMTDNLQKMFEIHQELNAGAHFPYHVE
jgi:cell wall assembly regulator SMI1